MALPTVQLSAQMLGVDQTLRNLNAFEKRVLPRADANALNRTATRARKNGIKRISQMEKRSQKTFRRVVRVVKRARARISQFAIITVFRRQDVATGRLSKPFFVPKSSRGPGMFRRRIPGRARTDDRPSTSPPNLPIYPEVDHVRNRREAIVKDEAIKAMKNYYPGELRSQLDRLVRKLLSRRRGRR